MLFGEKKWTDADLIGGCARNDRRAQEALYRRFFDPMLAMCKRHTADDDIAIGILNTAFLKIFRKIGDFNHAGSLEGWIRRIVWRCVVDYYRENARHIRLLIFEDCAPTEPTAEKDVFFEEDLHNAMQTLPELNREVFRLYAIEGYSHSEIGAILNISEGSSKWRLSAARERLRDWLIKRGGYYAIKSN